MFLADYAPMSLPELSLLGIITNHSIAGVTGKTEKQAPQILHHLEKHLGSGNYHYDVLLGEAKDHSRSGTVEITLGLPVSRLTLTIKP